MEIDYDYLQTGTAIRFRASRELCSNYLSRTCVELELKLSPSSKKHGYVLFVSLSRQIRPRGPTEKI